MKPNLHHFVLAACLGATTCSAAETPAAALLVLNKGDNTLARLLFKVCCTLLLSFIVFEPATPVRARLWSSPNWTSRTQWS